MFAMSAGEAEKNVVSSLTTWFAGDEAAEALLDTLYVLQEVANAYATQLIWALALTAGGTFLWIWRLLGRQEAARHHAHMVSSRPVFPTPSPLIPANTQSGNPLYQNSHFSSSFKNRYSAGKLPQHEDSRGASADDHAYRRYEETPYRHRSLPRSVWRRHGPRARAAGGRGECDSAAEEYSAQHHKSMPAGGVAHGRHHHNSRVTRHTYSPERLNDVPSNHHHNDNHHRHHHHHHHHKQHHDRPPHYPTYPSAEDWCGFRPAGGDVMLIRGNLCQMAPRSPPPGLDRDTLASAFSPPKRRNARHTDTGSENASSLDSPKSPLKHLPLEDRLLLERIFSVHPSGRRHDKKGGAATSVPDADMYGAHVHREAGTVDDATRRRQADTVAENELVERLRRGFLPYYDNHSRPSTFLPSSLRKSSNRNEKDKHRQERERCTQKDTSLRTARVCSARQPEFPRCTYAEDQVAVKKAAAMQAAAIQAAANRVAATKTAEHAAVRHAATMDETHAAAKQAVAKKAAGVRAAAKNTEASGDCGAVKHAAVNQYAGGDVLRQNTEGLSRSCTVNSQASISDGRSTADSVWMNLPAVEVKGNRDLPVVKAYDSPVLRAVKDEEESRLSQSESEMGRDRDSQRGDVSSEDSRLSVSWRERCGDVTQPEKTESDQDSSVTCEASRRLARLRQRLENSMEQISKQATADRTPVKRLCPPSEKVRVDAHNSNYSKPDILGLTALSTQSSHSTAAESSARVSTVKTSKLVVSESREQGGQEGGYSQGSIGQPDGAQSLTCSRTSSRDKSSHSMNSDFTMVSPFKHLPLEGIDRTSSKGKSSHSIDSDVTVVSRYENAVDTGLDAGVKKTSVEKENLPRDGKNHSTQLFKVEASQQPLDIRLSQISSHKLDSSQIASESLRSKECQRDNLCIIEVACDLQRENRRIAMSAAAGDSYLGSTREGLKECIDTSYTTRKNISNVKAEAITSIKNSKSEQPVDNVLVKTATLAKVLEPKKYPAVIYQAVDGEKISPASKELRETHLEKRPKRRELLQRRDRESQELYKTVTKIPRAESPGKADIASSAPILVSPPVRKRTSIYKREGLRRFTLDNSAFFQLQTSRAAPSQSADHALNLEKPDRKTFDKLPSSVTHRDLVQRGQQQDHMLDHQKDVMEKKAGDAAAGVNVPKVNPPSDVLIALEANPKYISRRNLRHLKYDEPHEHPNREKDTKALSPSVGGNSEGDRLEAKAKDAAEDEVADIGGGGERENAARRRARLRRMAEQHSTERETRVPPPVPPKTRTVNVTPQANFDTTHAVHRDPSPDALFTRDALRVARNSFSMVQPGPRPYKSPTTVSPVRFEDKILTAVKPKTGTSSQLSRSSFACTAQEKASVAVVGASEERATGDIREQTGSANVDTTVTQTQTAPVLNQHQLASLDISQQPGRELSPGRLRTNPTSPQFRAKILKFEQAMETTDEPRARTETVIRRSPSCSPIRANILMFEEVARANRSPSPRHTPNHSPALSPVRERKKRSPSSVRARFNASDKLDKDAA